MIVVLPADFPEPELARLRDDLRGRGWTVDDSRGAENTVLLVAGPSSVEELAARLSTVDADVLPVLELERYRRDQRLRRFLSAAITGLVVLLCTGLFVPAWAFLRPPTSAVVAPDLIHVPGAKDLPVGGARLLRVRGIPVQVLRLAPQRWHALSASCTHMESCLLEWSANQHRLLCACHGCAFDAYGNVQHPPASIPLPTYSVVESGGELYIRRTIL